MNENLTHDIPSNRRDVLNALLGNVVTRLVRFSWSPPEEVNSDRIECGQEPIPDSMVFSLASGPLGIWLKNGVVISAASESSPISVTLAFETDEQGETSESPLESDEDLHPIDATDQRYCAEALRRVLGKRIARISVLKRNPENPKWEDRPRESGVLLTFEGGGDLLLSHGLFYEHDDDFQVITKSQIHPSLVSQLGEIPVEKI